MLFLVHGSTATYHVGWTGDAGRCASAHNLLLWRAMEALQRRGVRRIDLGLLDTVNTPGLARFKLGAGRVPHRLGGTWLGF
jgi:lipid II:glycine glycyltransferase (peptidoglycan interpeptide bridge formation enzyme)